MRYTAGLAAAITAARAGSKVVLLEQNSFLGGALAIGLSGYKIDIHSGKDDGLYFEAVEKPFGIPYGALVSRDVDNLMFAGRCCSCDAVALGSLRVIPSCLGMGQAAGVGASLCARQNILPAQVDVQAVRSILLEQNAILSMEG